MDKAKVSWKYYVTTSTSGPDYGRRLEAIKHVRYGRDWGRNVILSPQTQILTDFSPGSNNLASVSWVTPKQTRLGPSRRSQRPSGPRGSPTLVDAIGNSPYWNTSCLSSCCGTIGAAGTTTPRRLSWILGTRYPRAVPDHLTLLARDLARVNPATCRTRSTNSGASCGSSRRPSTSCSYPSGRRANTFTRTSARHPPRRQLRFHAVHLGPSSRSPAKVSEVALLARAAVDRVSRDAIAALARSARWTLLFEFVHVLASCPCRRLPYCSRPFPFVTRPKIPGSSLLSRACFEHFAVWGHLDQRVFSVSRRRGCRWAASRARPACRAASPLWPASRTTSSGYSHLNFFPPGTTGSRRSPSRLLAWVFSTTALHAPSTTKRCRPGSCTGTNSYPARRRTSIQCRRPQRTPSRTFVNVETVNDFGSFPVP